MKQRLLTRLGEHGTYVDKAVSVSTIRFRLNATALIKTLVKSAVIGLAFSIGAYAVLLIIALVDWFRYGAWDTILTYEQAGDVVIAVFSATSAAYFVCQRIHCRFALALLVVFAGAIVCWMIGAYFGVTPNYRKTIRWYHPDFVAWLLIPPWVMAFAASILCRTRTNHGAVKTST